MCSGKTTQLYTYKYTIYKYTIVENGWTSSSLILYIETKAITKCLKSLRQIYTLSYKAEKQNQNFTIPNFQKDVVFWISAEYTLPALFTYRFVPFLGSSSSSIWAYIQDVLALHSITTVCYVRIVNLYVSNKLLFQSTSPSAGKSKK